MEEILEKIKSSLNYFTKWELALWGSSVLLIIISFILFDRANYMTLTASVIGATSLIFSAKGHPAGQVFMIIFSILYGIISFRCAYYGEMVTYLGMTLPMAVISLVAWLKNPFSDDKTEVKVNKLKHLDIILMTLLTTIVTIAFYFILKYFNTANLIPSTISITTSFVAAYLTFRRSPYFAAAYALNDVVLIILWIMATTTDMSYFSVIICFVIFLVNDIYGFANWCKMQKRQECVA